MKIIENFLSREDFEITQKRTNVQRGVRDVLGNLQKARFLVPVLRAAAEKIEEVNKYELQQVLLRFEGRTGLLHHDLNKATKRTISLIFYIDEPILGGEIIFPFFDSAGKPTSNIVTEACENLYRQEQFYSEDRNIERYMIDNKDSLFTLSARSNTAIVFHSYDKTLWHFACPVTEGNRSCLVIFYKNRTERESV